MTRGSRLNLDHRRRAKPSCSRMEWLSRHQNESIAKASKSLLKAQLTTGQHTLDKDCFVDTAIKHGWILQIPERLLV